MRWGLAWRGLLRLHRQDSATRLLSTAGVLLLVTTVLVWLAIAYLLAVVSAVVARRSLAVRITGLGDTAAGIVVGGWTGTDFSPAFLQQLAGLVEQVTDTAERHLAYPVVRFFHRRPGSGSRRRRTGRRPRRPAPG